MASLGRTDLDVFPLCLGGNVFGWTADEPQSHAVLDAYTSAGGNFVDTANSYLVEHGGSETIIGRWLAARGNRDAIVLATKVGGGRGAVRNLRAETIEREAHASLERLQTDRIDLYYAHFDDETTPLEETLGAFDELVTSGKIRYAVASNYSAARLTEAMDTSERLGITRYVGLQPHYNLMERPVYEDELRDAVQELGLGSFPYFALARGFLTGKYRAGEPIDSPRAKGASQYVGEKGDRVLAALAAVALRWLADQPTVTAPIASGRSVEQLADLLPMLDLRLTDEERQRLTDASS